MRSLRARLLLGTILAMASVLVAAGFAVHALVQSSLVSEVDRTLDARVRLLGSTIEMDGDEVEIDFEELDMSEFASVESGGFLQVTLGDERLHASPSLGAISLPQAPAADAATATWVTLPGGGRGRALTYRFKPRQDHDGDHEESPELSLVLARDTSAVDAALATLATTLIGVGLISVLLVAGALAFVVRRSLRSLEAVSTQIAAIDADRPSGRIDTRGVPSELLPVVERMNELIARLGTALERERAFSNDVAHELRTPLAGLRTSFEVGATRERSSAEYAELLRGGVEQVDRLRAMVERLLQLARLDGEPSQELGVAFDPSELALEAWEACAHAASARHLRVKWTAEEGLTMTSDPELFRLVLRNLFDNAVTYADEGGAVTISLKGRSSDFVLSVANSGSTVSAQDAALATERFWRGDDARTDVGHHCGLGLAIVQRVAKRLGGRLQLASEVGGEFTATVELPRATSRLPARSSSPPAPSASSPSHRS